MPQGSCRLNRAIANFVFEFGQFLREGIDHDALEVYAIYWVYTDLRLKCIMMITLIPRSHAPQV
jgi:hypothetical protein